MNKGTYQSDTQDHPIETPKRRKRVFLWVFLAIQVIYLIWVITGISTANSGDASCVGTYDEELCRDAGDVGTTLGVGFVVFLWAATDIIVGGFYALYRLVKRNG